MLKEILTEHQVQKSQLVRCWQNTNEWVSFGQGILMQWLDLGQIKTICGNILKCVLGLDREVYSVFSHVSIAIWGQNTRRQQIDWGKTRSLPRTQALGSLTVEPWWTRGGRALLVGWFHDEATNGQSGPSCPHCRSNHLFNDQTPDKKLSLNTFLSNLIGTVHKLHNRGQGGVWQYDYDSSKKMGICPIITI